MPNWKEGDKVRVIEREVTEEDRKTNRYFPHMAGLTGVVQNVYSTDQIAVNVDMSSVSKVTKDVQKVATERMRANINEAQRRDLTAEELNFVAHYVILVRSDDIEKAS